MQILNNHLSLNWHASSKGSYTLAYMLTKQLPTGSNGLLTDFAMHNVNLVQQYNYHIKGVRATTLLMNTLMMNKNGMADFSTKRINLQNGVQQTFNFQKGITFQPGAGVNVNSDPLIAGVYCSYWVEAGNTFAIKGKANLQYHVRYNMDKLSGNSVNGTLGLSVKWYKALQFNSRAQIMYLTTSYMPWHLNMLNATGGLNYAW